MSGDGLPDFNHGQHWRNVSARSMRNLVDRVRGSKLSISGASLSTAVGNLVTPGAERGGGSRTITVAVTKAGDDEEGTPMEVREVTYRGMPPVVGEYEWRGPKHERAYPEVGATFAEYASVVWDKDEPPDKGTVLLTARSRGGIWFLDRPAAGGQIAQFYFDGMSDDFVIGRLHDGTLDPKTGRPSGTGIVNPASVNIAKPFRLRRTPFDGRTVDGLSYTYQGGERRLETTNNNQQVIIPPYRLGDLIYAATGIKPGTGVVWLGRKLAWLDINADGRAWGTENAAD